MNLLEIFLAGGAAQTMRQCSCTVCSDAGKRQPNALPGGGGLMCFNSQHKNKPDELADR